jgi:hypothetical protein
MVQVVLAHTRWIAPIRTGLPGGVDVAAVNRGAVDPCLVGTWVETTRVGYRTVGGLEVRLESHGRTVGLRADGTGVTDLGTASPQVGTVDGRPVEVTTTGTVTFTYEAGDGRITYRDIAGGGSATARIAGVERPLEAPDTGEVDAYTCRSDGTLGLVTESGTHSVELRRTGNPPPRPDTDGSDPCVLGTWTERSNAFHDVVWWHGSGAVQRFNADGTGHIDYGKATVHRADIVGPTWRIVRSGRVTFRYQVRGGLITYTHGRGDGTWTVYREGEVFERRALSGELTTDTYTCAGQTMRQRGESYVIELVRTG